MNTTKYQYFEKIFFSPWTPKCYSIPTNTIFTPLNPIFKLNPSWIFLHEYHKTSILWINIFLNVQLQLLEYIIYFYHEHSKCQLIQSSPLILTNSSWILLHKYHKILFSPWIFNYNAPGIYQHLLSPNVTQKYHSTPTFEPPKPYKFNKFFSTISSSQYINTYSSRTPKISHETPSNPFNKSSSPQTPGTPPHPRNVSNLLPSPLHPRQYREAGRDSKHFIAAVHPR